MKPRILHPLVIIFCLAFLFMPGASTTAQTVEEETKTPEAPPVDLPSSDRPLIVINSYYLDQDTIRPGESFTLFLSIENTGALTAHNLIFTFSGDQFLPQETGGVVAVGSLGADDDREITQRLLANNSLWGKTNGTVNVGLTYNGPAGEAYSESFTITLDVLGWSANWATATPTPTGTALPRPQLVVNSYQSDVDPLQPGSIFNLDMEIRNLGNGEAKAVTMVIGGGAVNSSPPETTPQPGGVPAGVSGAGADLSVFAPLGSSNLQFLNDIAPGTSLRASQKLIVNVSANPGAYALKISFVYNDAKGNRLVDDQIITLLVYQLPQVDVNFYRDPGPISAMAPNTLPLQVVNLGRKSTVLGNMTVSANNAELMNNVSLVGTLDAGGYFPLDVMLIPQAGGPLEVRITINYTDDFNQPRTIEKSISLEIMESAPMPPVEPGMEGPGVGPGMEGGPAGGPVDVPVIEETFWQKVLRFLKGMVGLDSAPPQPEQFPGEMPPGEMEPLPNVKPLG